MSNHWNNCLGIEIGMVGGSDHWGQAGRSGGIVGAGKNLIGPQRLLKSESIVVAVVDDDDDNDDDDDGLI